MLHAPNSAEARKAWVADPTLDAWLIWNIWQKASPDLADTVPTESPFTIYRSCGAAVTSRTSEPALAEAFLAFLESAEGRSVFAKWGWITSSTSLKRTVAARGPKAGH